MTVVDFNEGLDLAEVTDGDLAEIQGAIDMLEEEQARTEEINEINRNVREFE